MRRNLKRRTKVLDLLYHYQTDYLSGAELSDQLDVSRTTIWKYINYFREAGYEIESSSKLGYRLVETPDILLPEEIKRNLTTNQIGHQIIHYNQIDSTNRVAKEQAKNGVKEGTVIISEEQTGGKGRLNRNFSSPQGGIWLSYILSPDLKPVMAGRATYLSALALAKTINQITNLDAKIKWPNDVLINDKKVSGILTEMGAELDKVNYLAIGMGINANFAISKLPVELHNKVTTIFNELGEQIDRVAFVQSLLQEIEKLYPKLDNFEELLAEWKGYAYTLGQEVKIADGNQEYSGLAVDIADDGALIVKTDRGQEKVYSGDVSLSHQSFNSGN
ncbi:birA, biotin-(acetyl-CoA-carboxylase) ligase [Halobacteroides halobius DSM 5150]|uniref:Bifunctional ligase/repressor BirA n=1 Tax=Halobacteroides halobius (strain ATCC 35273 / DSM 5150 / MD-1) TaxID=748449 RepID=L0K564_HALHC|nr:biotin--[acetyl-CoA-carboxylase] ligase [Halobacteroides halobius]AGB40156.1 birA, biotin-(acetyl-CoA-carboxylase) ligase [Halobacteroides halobius DSM 5150]